MIINGIKLEQRFERGHYFRINPEDLINGKIDPKKITSFNINKDTVNGKVDIQYFYPADASKIDIAFFKELLYGDVFNKEEKITVFKQVIDFLNTTEGQFMPPWNDLKPYLEYKGNRVFIYPVNHKRLTLDTVDELFNHKPSKALIRSILSELDLQNSSKDLIIDYIKRDRIDIFRVIGKSNTTQMNKKELKEIIALPQFTKKTTAGLIGATETADAVNRRAIILYQDAADGEIFMEIVNSIKDDQAKDKFFKTLKRKIILDKFKDYPEVMLWIKMQ